jgi:hypothetical protein
MTSLLKTVAVNLNEHALRTAVLLRQLVQVFDKNNPARMSTMNGKASVHENKIKMSLGLLSPHQYDPNAVRPPLLVAMATTADSIKILQRDLGTRITFCPACEAASAP